MFDDFWSGLKCVVVALLIVGFIGLFCYAVVIEESSKVEAVVVSCEKGEYSENAGYKAMAVNSFINGNTLNAVTYNNLSKVNAQKYVVVVEYEGVQYTVEMSHEQTVGDVIRIKLPKE